MTRDRRGFTMVELIIVTVLGTLVVGAALQVLITNRRAYTAHTATIAGQQSTRMAVEVLFAELREISSSGGDVVAMSSDSLRVRLMRKFSYVCATDFTLQPKLTVLDTLGSIPVMGGANRFAVGDSVVIYADNDEDYETDDVWIAADIALIDGTATCPQNGEGGTELTFTGLAALFSADSVGIGAPVRSFQTYTFGTTTMNGDVYLSRRIRGGDMVPITGPLQDTNGLEFIYRDSLGVVTADVSAVSQIQVIVRTGSRVLGSLGELVSDSVDVWIHTRG